MPLLHLSRSRRRTFPAMQSMLAAMPPIDPRQFERAVDRARQRLETIAETVSHETVAEIIEDLKHEAAPIAARAVPIIERAAERATGRRRRSRKPKAALIVAGLVVLAGVVAYLLWQRRDEEPAHLMQTPDRPDPTPAQTPPSAPDGPVAPSGLDMSAPAVEARTDAISSMPAGAPARELAGTPHAIFGLGDRDEFDDRPVDGPMERPAEGVRGLPIAPRANFVPPPPPSTPRRSWLPR